MTLIDGVVKYEITHSTLKTLYEVVVLIRAQMAAMSNSFLGTFPKSCQQTFYPQTLLSLFSMLIDGGQLRSRL